MTTPSQQPFQAAFEPVSFGTLEYSIQVPANKRLVIEVISIYALLEVDGSFPNFFVPYVTTSVNSQLIQHYVATGTPRDDNQPGLPHTLFYSISQPTRLYADPGTTVTLKQFGQQGQGIVRASISGYLLAAVP